MTRQVIINDLKRLASEAENNEQTRILAGVIAAVHSAAEFGEEADLLAVILPFIEVKLALLQRSVIQLPH